MYDKIHYKLKKINKKINKKLKKKRILAFIYEEKKQNFNDEVQIIITIKVFFFFFGNIDIIMKRTVLFIWDVCLHACSVMSNSL